jgi:hypothetical protein
MSARPAGPDIRGSSSAHRSRSRGAERAGARLASLITASLLVLACSRDGGSAGSPAEAPTTCGSACPAAGATQCSGSQIQTCTADASGCLAWSAPAACPTGLTCDAGLNACAGRLVTLSWTANRESGVNRAGGGYELQVSGHEPVVIPYVSGATAPTSAALRLPSGDYTVSVRAFAALDMQGGSARTYSAASQAILLGVP